MEWEDGGGWGLEVWQPGFPWALWCPLVSDCRIAPAGQREELMEKEEEEVGLGRWEGVFRRLLPPVWPTVCPGQGGQEAAPRARRGKRQDLR